MPRGRGEHGQWTWAVPTPTSSQDREPAAAVIGPWLPFWGRGAPRGEGRSGRPLSSSGCQTGSGRAARSTGLSLRLALTPRRGSHPVLVPLRIGQKPPPFPAARNRPGLLALSDPSPNPPRPPPPQAHTREPLPLPHAAAPSRYAEAPMSRATPDSPPRGTIAHRSGGAPVCTHNPIVASPTPSPANRCCFADVCGMEAMPGVYVTRVGWAAGAPA